MSTHQGSERRSRALPAKRLWEAVYDDLKARILNGNYAPGEWLSVDECTQVYGVSRQPVMEAMRRLSGDWLVEIIPQVGCAVANYDPDAIREFITIFGEMEGDVAALAAQRRTSEQLHRATTLAQQLAPLEVSDDEARMLARDYHRVILEMAHSAVLERLCRQMWDFAAFTADTVAPMDRETMRRQGAIVVSLAEAIRDSNAALARLHMTVWLTGLHDPKGPAELDASVTVAAED